jgi:hypothetical protein
MLSRAVIAENIKSLLLSDSPSLLLQTCMSTVVISQCSEVVGAFGPKIERRTRLAASLIMQYTSFSWFQIVMFWRFFVFC